MTVKGFLKKWYGREIEDWGGTTSDEYKAFQSDYRSAIKSFCKDIGMELHAFNKHHYDFSCVLQSEKTGQFYYVSISDVRYWNNEWADHVLYRTMKHEKDWTGGSNRYSSLEDLAENLAALDERQFDSVQRLIGEAAERSVVGGNSGQEKEHII